jgi:hypothetical protein
VHVDTNTVIRLLTGASLGGLLFTVGIRLTWWQISDAMRQGSLALLLPINCFARRGSKLPRHAHRCGGMSQTECC